MRKLEGSIEKLIETIIVSIPAIISGFVILIVGSYAIRFLLNLMTKRFEKRNVDKSIRTFVYSLTKIALYVLLFLTVASTMGIQTTSFIAALSAFGLAVGMALQGSLSNFAGGVLILMFRPFEVGDSISSANGSSGTVEKIDLLYTTLTDDNGIRVFSPNGTLANSVIRNFSKVISRRMEFTVLMAYEVNIKTAREAIMDVIKADSRILETPKPTVVVGDLKDNGIEVVIRAWAPKDVFWAAKWEVAEKLQQVFEGQNVVFPVSSMRVIQDNQA
ncbi:mechanosensitive ion channel family protein [Sphingobacterium sp. Mn56C]|uniref:mechanosensitive ion channel family protein n=1 Tax=Sphingobacterium sp. Mn56C TaxID=3395261 RepID=UPI003BDE2B00